MFIFRNLLDLFEWIQSSVSTQGVVPLLTGYWERLLESIQRAPRFLTSVADQLKIHVQQQHFRFISTIAFYSKSKFAHHVLWQSFIVYQKSILVNARKTVNHRICCDFVFDDICAIQMLIVTFQSDYLSLNDDWLECEMTYGDVCSVFLQDFSRILAKIALLILNNASNHETNWIMKIIHCSCTWNVLRNLCN